MVFRFRKFRIYHEAKTLHIKIVKVTQRFPREYNYITTQICRSSLLPVLNIAEGAAKRSDKDFNRYLENSMGSIMGSINETMAGLEVVLELKLITLKEFKEFEEAYSNLVNQIGGFSKKLLKSG